MRSVCALLVLAVVLVVVANLLPGNGAVEYPLLLLVSGVALVAALVRLVVVLVGRRRRPVTRT